jgi:ribosomal protein S18 acetylase RimI-like enzyme
MHVPRPLTLQDLPDLLTVQRACYGDGYIESAAVYAHRLVNPAQCSWVIEHAGRICAYLAAYDSAWEKLTPLHGDFEAADPPDTLYLHDLAVLPELSGQGLAKALLTPLWSSAAARGLRRSALVAVQSSHRFWERQGYAAHPLQDARQRQHLSAYGEGAHYMQRRL